MKDDGCCVAFNSSKILKVYSSDIDFDKIADSISVSHMAEKYLRQ